jgi:hypothetical protein
MSPGPFVLNSPKPMAAELCRRRLEMSCSCFLLHWAQ